MSHVQSEDPGRTAAVVVGIERYLDPDRTLPGVAESGRSFARWLVARGVPPERVHVLLSDGVDPPLPFESTRHDGLSVSIHPHRASVNALHHAFDILLPRWHAGGDLGLVFVYWAGHGAIDRTCSCLLELPESSPGRRLVLDLHSLLTSLLDPDYPKLQAVFVDTCAADLRRDDEGREPGRFRFGSRLIDPSRKQFVFYSQRPGLRAPNLSPDDPRSFHAVLLSELDAVSDAQSNQARPWPPDLPRVARRVRHHFDQFRAGKSFGQFPVFFDQDWYGTRHVAPTTWEPQPARRPALDPRVDAFAEVLETLPSLAERLGRESITRALASGSLADRLDPDIGREFYREFARNVVSAPADLGRLLEAMDRVPGLKADSTDASQMFNVLDKLIPLAIHWSEAAQACRLILSTRELDQELVCGIGRDVIHRETQGELANRLQATADHGTSALILGVALATSPRGEPPILRLVRRLQACVPDSRPQSGQLDAWVNRVAKRFPVTAPPPVTPDPPKGDESARLTVCVEQPLNGTAKFLVRSWLELSQGDGARCITPAEDTVEIESIPLLVNDLLRETRGVREVELFLPLDMLAAGIGRRGIPVGPDLVRPLDTRFLVKLRSWDRIYNHDPEAYFDEVARDLWKDRWHRPPTDSETVCEEHCAWIRNTDDLTERIYDDHTASGPVCVAALLHSPQPAADLKRVVRTLHLLLLAGTPILLWPDLEAGCHSRLGPSAVFEKLRSFVLGRARGRIPALVLEHRKPSPGGDPGDPCKNLCLLWDDPGRLPPGYGEAFPSLGYPYTR